VAASSRATRTTRKARRSPCSTTGRAPLRDPWSAPVDLGASVNTTAAETRPSLAGGAETLLFGRAPGPEGMSDIYMATRDELGGSDDDGDDGEGDDDE